MLVDSNNSNIFSQIRKTARLVAESAKNVHINQHKINAYVEDLPIGKINNPPLDPNIHYLGQGRDTLAYFLTLETINFGSGYFPHLDNNSKESGYFTIAGALNDYYIQNGLLTATDLIQLTGRDCATIFKQSWDNLPIRELMERFSVALNQLGQFILEKFDGKFEALFELANHSAEKLVELLIQIPCFQDVADYGPLKVFFLKRAQITAADISLAFSNKGLGYFKDLDQLTIFADNMVPHVLRCDGILEYKESLASIIDSRQLLLAGSAGEIEIRACAIHVVELIREQFKRLGYDFTSVDLDYLLWNRGLQPDYDKIYPIHLTRTMFY